MAATAAAAFSDFAVRIGSTAVLARLLLPEHFGLVMMATAVTAVADQLRDLGLSSATVQKPEITHAEVTNLFWVNVGVSATLAAMLCGASPLIAAYYHDPRLVAIACLLSLTLVCGGLTVQHQALLTRQLRLGQTATIRLTSSVLSTLLAIGLAVAGWGYWALLWREVARAAFLATGMWLAFRWIPGLPSRQTNVRGQLKFGANLTLANILGTMAAGTDRFLLGHFWGAGPVALYRQAYQLIAAPTDQLLSPVYQVAQPCLSMLQNEPERFRRFYARVVTVVGLITMPLSLFVAVYAREVTLILLGPRWLDSAPLLGILSLGTFVKQSISSSGFVPIARGQGGVYLRLSVLQNATLVTLMLLAVRWGPVGIACADVTTTYLILGPRLWNNLRRSPVSVANFLAAAARPVGASIVMALVLFAFKAHVALTPIPGLLTGGLVGATAFLATWLLIPGGAGETKRIVADLQRAFQRRRPEPNAAEPAATAA